MWLALFCFSLSAAKQSPASYFYNAERPLIIAHRGACGYIPEHTLQAYDIAAYMGVDFIEPDLVPSKDGHFIINHDPLLDDTTNVAALPKFAHLRTTKTINTVNGPETQTGWFTEDFTLEEIKELRATQRLAIRPQTLNNLFQKITIDEALDWTIETNKNRIAQEKKLLGVYIELKDPAYFNSIGYPVEEMLISILRARGIDSVKGASEICPIILQCFELESLQKMKMITDLPLVYLVSGKNIPFNITDYAEIVNGVGPSADMVFNPDGSSTGFLQQAHAAELAVHPWVVRDDVPFGPFTRQQIYMLLRGSGVDGIFDEFPDSASVYFTLN